MIPQKIKDGIYEIINETENNLNDGLDFDDSVKLSDYFDLAYKVNIRTEMRSQFGATL